MRSGIVRYDLWFLVDPDANPSELSEGKTPEEAFEKSYEIARFNHVYSDWGNDDPPR
jgi:hypothetical protein